MKSKIYLSIIFFLFFYSLIANAGTILPETPTEVKFSNHDINRIVCAGRMNDLIFSKEKGITGHFSGNSAFIKFKIKKRGDKYIYAKEPAELFVVCDDTVYSLIVVPGDIPSVTQRLTSVKPKSIKKNIAHYKNLPLEKKALQIIREAYHNSFPSDYKLTSSRREVSVSPKFSTVLNQTVNIDGVGLGLKKYEITARQNIRVIEQDFLTSKISDSILAIAVEDHVLNSGESTRVFVVEKREREE